MGTLQGHATIAVNGAAGGLAVAAGSVALVYGQPVLMNEGAPIPWLYLTDSTGVSRISRVFHAAPSSINFVVPSGLKPGLVQVAVVNEGGPNLAGFMIVQPVAPGPLQFHRQRSRPGNRFPAGCKALSVDRNRLPLRRQSLGYNRRQARPHYLLRAYDQTFGTDQAVIEIPKKLAGAGLADLILTADSQVANAVQLAVPRDAPLKRNS